MTGISEEKTDGDNDISQKYPIMVFVTNNPVSTLLRSNQLKTINFMDMLCKSYRIVDIADPLNFKESNFLKQFGQKCNDSEKPILPQIFWDKFYTLDQFEDILECGLPQESKMKFKQVDVP
ncbi:hypothetical protein GJ496_003345 [Pomphorhynchus laevis]|nr:hypothetical protein GJ496_003345 [Pomphorhynchus laevis]